ncbi:sulfite oxidase heme-binding subunit YedZ [Vannielia litorea]|uniref:sulfite oxidase heme-binding subunit YedZ n=1 Tax=Vannielia litorea TaxID=1217970 RepID=UPI0021BDDBE9|nr:ferric reductase-like transmembrane domain-containing protein [Vannielia litorea]
MTALDIQPARDGSTKRAFREPHVPLPRLHPFPLWLALSLPAAAILTGLARSGGNIGAGSEALHMSGELSAWLLIATMLASPLALALRGWRGPRWLLKNRRYLGVAAFGYGALHTLLYILDRQTLGAVLSEATRFDIWTGWLAFLIFIPLAATSTDAAMRRLGRHWKTLQRFVYLAALLTALHWAALHKWGGIAPAALFFTPLAALEAYRLRIWLLRPRRDIPTAKETT